jgi:hypothetical protein
MKIYLNRLYMIFMKSNFYVLLFFIAHNFFRNDPVPVIFMPIYFLFIIACFSLFYLKKLKIDGTIHLLWILSSSLFYARIFQSYGISFSRLDYAYVIIPIFAISLLLPLVRIKGISKQIGYLMMTLYLLSVITVFIIALLSTSAFIWLIVLLLFKFLPYVSSYMLSKMYSFNYEKTFFLMFFLPFMILVNLYASLSGSCQVIPIKDVLKNDN